MKKASKNNKSSITPLWVISLFLTLTETVLGFGVTKTTDGVQVAIVAFVLIFPLLVAVAFFLILWKKPYVLYSPFEFGTAEDAVKFIEAISRDAKEIQQKATEAKVAVEEIEKLKLELINQAKDLEEKIEKAKNEAFAMSFVHAQML